REAATADSRDSSAGRAARQGPRRRQRLVGATLVVARRSQARTCAGKTSPSDSRWRRRAAAGGGRAGPGRATCAPRRRRRRRRGEEGERGAREAVRALGDGVVALSGGIDSALVVTIAAQEWPAGRCVALTSRSESLAAEELEDARAQARRAGVEHVVLAGHEL